LRLAHCDAQDARPDTTASVGDRAPPRRPPDALSTRLLAGACLVLSLSAISAPAAATGGVNIPEMLSRPGVRLVALEFYATWCKPCMASMPRWAELKKRYYKQVLRVVVVLAGKEERAALSAAWG
jgi:thiol-disulfide isomerase/thioredoxin